MEVQKINGKKHISYSELKDWYFCAFKHKLIHIDKLRIFQGNVHTAFGTAIHSVAENQIKNRSISNWDEVFLKKFLEEIKKLPEQHIKENKKTLLEMKNQGLTIIKYIFPELKKKFGDFEVIGTEKKLYEQIEECVPKKIFFKGFIDLIIRTTDGKYHIIDHKTTTINWFRDKRNDKLTLYQIIFYKYFYAKKNNINFNDIECYYFLLKRKTQNVELFKITSGNKRISNALSLLNQCIKNIDKNNFPKNKLSCENCIFHRTEYCP